MPETRTILLLGLLLCFPGLSACTSVGGDMSTSLAMAPAADMTLSLPETVEILPESSGLTALASVAPVENTATADVVPPVEVVALGEAPGESEPQSFLSSAFARAETPRGDLDRLIAKYATLYEVPEALVRRVVNRESTYNPLAYNNGHWGLMQIKHATARGMGYRGPARGLLDAETNLKYAVKYLRGAWMVADGNADFADRLYQRGYYYDAKRKGLLDETGLGRDRVRKRRA